MAKFKVGDMVRRINYNNGWGDGTVLKVGEVVKVEEIRGRRGDIGIRINGKIYHGNNPDNFELVCNPSKIVITTDGKTTTARLFEGKELIKKAEAKCSPNDKFDLMVGAKLAMERLEEKKLEEPGFKVGDKVRIINSGNMYSSDYLWVKSHVTDIELATRYSYDHNPWYPAVLKVDKTFEIKVVDSDKAYITNVNEYKGPCFLIGIDGIEKI